MKKMGDSGEEVTRLFLKSKGFNLTKPDWEFEKDGRYISVEVKHKSEAFKKGWAGNGYCGFDGQGLDIYQIRARERRYQKTGIRNLLLIVNDEDGTIKGNWLDILEGKEYFDTKNRIRIYPLAGFIDADLLL